MNSLTIMAAQTRPKGTHWTVDEAWKTGVRADMAKAGISSAELGSLPPNSHVELVARPLR